MTRTYTKNILRTFKNTKNRFFAIFSIVTLGVGFLAGLNSTPDDMKESMEAYMDDGNFYDLRIVSTLGLTDADVSALEAVEGVAQVQPAYAADALIDTGGDTVVAHVHSLASDNDTAINRLVLTEGRFPENAGECLVEMGASALSASYPIGTTLTVSSENEAVDDTFAQTEYTVVGIVRSSNYFSFEREPATVGNGTVNLVFYVLPEAFSYEVYTEIYLTVDGALAANSLGDDYEPMVEVVKERIEDIASEREQARYDEILADAQEQIDDAWAEYYDGEAEANAELADALEELTDAEDELADGKKELADGWQEYNDGLSEYNDGVSELAENEQKLADAEVEIADARQEIADGEKAIADAQKQLDDAGRQLLDAKKTLDAGQAEYDAGLAQYNEGLAQYEAGLAQYEAGYAQYEAGYAQYEEGLAGLDALRAALDAGLSGPGIDETTYQTLSETLAATKVTLNENKAILDTSKATLDATKVQLDTAKTALDSAKAQLDSGWAQYNDGSSQLSSGQSTLDEKKQELADGKQKLAESETELADARNQLEDGRKELAEAKKKLADALKELTDGEQELAGGEQELADGWREYYDGKAEAEEELADAKAEIEDAQKELADIEMPEWYVWDRDKNVSYSSFTANIDKLTAITTIFPIFFFLVAALVVSTTMTRMVEEERLQIGTLKALGYSSTSIMRKYLLYALAASLAGTVVGLAIGFSAFPTIIWSAYEMMYYMPSITTPWRLAQALFSGGTMTLLTLAVTALSCRASLREVPASLMLPRAPKAGKRILLEHITPLWRRLPFSWKVTCRNLLRYKKRFWMTVIGVAGCTSLLIAGFGISDSLNAIILKQYSDVYHFDLTTIVTKESALTEGAVYEYLYENPDLIETSLTVSMETTRQETEAGNLDVYLMIPQDLEQFQDFADLHERVSGKTTPLGEEGIVITEKMAKTLGVGAGDTITLQNGDDIEGTFVITGVCEHYLSNYVYLSPTTYEAGFGEACEYNAVISRLVADTQENRDTASLALLAMDNVASLSFTQDAINQVENMLTSMDAVVLLIIVCAAGLAFVVLYNLSNINIAERVKEIATIKVLGFYPGEVRSYVNRESVALTLIGILFGIAGGIGLHRFVITTVEVDAVMFGREIDASSFVYAILLTLLFSSCVNLVMNRYLKRISMVESMKAPE